jgi:hypothetical protein
MLQGDVGRVRNDRAVHQRIAVGHADLNDVHTSLDHGDHGVDGALPRPGTRRAGSPPAPPSPGPWFGKDL